MGIKVLFSMQFSQHLSHNSTGIFTRVFLMHFKKPNAICKSFLKPISSDALEYEQLLWETIPHEGTGDLQPTPLEKGAHCNSLREEPTFASRPELWGPCMPLLAIMFMLCVLMTMMQCYTPPEKENEMFCFALNVFERLDLSFSLNVQ